MSEKINAKKQITLDCSSTVAKSSTADQQCAASSNKENKEVEYQKKIVELRGRYLDSLTSFLESHHLRQPDEGERKHLAKTKVLIDVLNGSHKVSLDVLSKCETSLNMIFCRLCDKSFKEAVFLPCGHKEVCEECSTTIKKCFVCYTMIEEKKIFRHSPCHFKMPSSCKRKYKEIEEELTEMKEALCCPICLDAKRDTVLIGRAFSCGHTVCAGCAPGINKCPICRKEVLYSMKFYPS